MKSTKTREIVIEIVRVGGKSARSMAEKSDKKPSVQVKNSELEKTGSVWNIFSTNFLKKLSRNLRLS